jgi:hypothetical protein
MESLEKYINMNEDVMRSVRKSRTPNTYLMDINTKNLMSSLHLSQSSKQRVVENQNPDYYFKVKQIEAYLANTDE